MPALLAALLFAPLTAGVVLEVSPTGPFTQIEAAVNAANDGDLVLVHGGTYTSFTVQSKSLTVVADTAAIVNLQGGVRVLDLAAGQTVCLIGLHAFDDPDPFPPFPWGLRAESNLGRVRCEHCEFVGSWDGNDGVSIESCADVSFVACQLRGSAGVSVGGAGARAIGSTLTFFDCSVRGGDGTVSDSNSIPSGGGGQGLHAENCTIFSSNAGFLGGAGGFGYVSQLFAPAPGAGGAGVELVPGCQMRLLDTALDGGEFGDPDYPDADAPNTIGGTFTQLSGTKRTMTVPNPVRELTPLSFSFHGAPGENVYLLVGLEPGLQWDPAHEANFLLASPFRRLPVGTTNGSGDLGVSLPLSDLGAGVQFDMFYLQPVFVGPGGAQQLGTPITLAALDQSF